MQVEITVKVAGKLVKRHVEQVGGTLEEMEETIHALSKTVDGETLQASVDAVDAPLTAPAISAVALNRRKQRKQSCS